MLRERLKRLLCYLLVILTVVTSQPLNILAAEYNFGVVKDFSFEGLADSGYLIIDFRYKYRINKDEYLQYIKTHYTGDFDFSDFEYTIYADDYVIGTEDTEDSNYLIFDFSSYCSYYSVGYVDLSNPIECFYAKSYSTYYIGLKCTNCVSLGWSGYGNLDVKTNSNVDFSYLGNLTRSTVLTPYDGIIASSVDYGFSLKSYYVKILDTEGNDVTSTCNYYVAPRTSGSSGWNDGVVAVFDDTYNYYKFEEYDYDKDIGVYCFKFIASNDGTFPHIHKYFRPTFSWSEDLTECTATFTCTDDENCNYDEKRSYSVPCEVKVYCDDPTCTESTSGYVRATETDSGFFEDKSISYDALGHLWESDWIEVNSSEVTEDLFTGAENASDLDFSSYTSSCYVYKRECSRAYDAYELKVLDHICDSDVETKENEVSATCLDEGSYDLVKSCSVCGTEQSREQKTISALGHDMSEWEISKESKLDEKGTKKRECKRINCDYFEEEDTDFAYATIEGYLKDSDNNPLSDVLIELHSETKTATTDSNGYFKFEDVEAGTHSLQLLEDSTVVYELKAKIEEPLISYEVIQNDTYTVAGSVEGYKMSLELKQEEKEVPPVTTKYTLKVIDKFGDSEEIRESKEVESGYEYSYTALIKEGWVVDGASSYSGTVTEDTTITFNYKEEEETPPEATKYTLKVIDKFGDAEEVRETKEVEAGYEYSYSALNKDNWKVVGESTYSGTVTADTTITFNYTEDDDSDSEVEKVTLKVIDHWGSSTSTRISTKVDKGSSYSYNALTKDGWEVKGDSKKSGTANKNTEVHFYYTEKSSSSSEASDDNSSSTASTTSSSTVTNTFVMPLANIEDAVPDEPKTGDSSSNGIIIALFSGLLAFLATFKKKED